MSQHLTTFYLLPVLYTHVVHVGVECLKTITMIYNNHNTITAKTFAISTFSAHTTICSGIDCSTFTGCKVYASVHATIMQNGMITRAKSRDQFALTFGNGHNGRHCYHTFLLVASHFINIIK